MGRPKQIIKRIADFAMIVLFAAAAHYINRLLGKFGRKAEKERPNGRGWKVLAFAVPMMVCIFVAVTLIPEI